MNVVLLIIDSLRAASLAATSSHQDVAMESSGGCNRSAVGPSPIRPCQEPSSDGLDVPLTPFFERLNRETCRFTKNYATECWTLPTHASMFTGLLPSEHRAHFQTMAYVGKEPTVAELLSEAGAYTEILTRCPIFDGSIPGITRGFAHATTALASPGPWTPAALLLALSKPRFRRQMEETGFFHPSQRKRADFMRDFVRSMFPSDALLLEHLLERMREMRHSNRPYFLFCNLFDVHAPYCPSTDSLFRPIDSLRDALDNLLSLDALARVGRHEYLKQGFSMSDRNRIALLRRYHDAIALMDTKIARFYDDARGAGLLDDTMLIVAADHGEAFGEHGLYFHDASVYNTHLRVPLWVHHPDHTPCQIDDVVSMAGIFDLIREVGLGRGVQNTPLARDYREQHPIALSEHFHYPHVKRARACYRQDLVAGVVGNRKLIVRGRRIFHFDLKGDPLEQRPIEAPLEEIGSDPDFQMLTVPLRRLFSEHLRPRRAAGARTPSRG